jgi:hypothetical protein
MHEYNVENITYTLVTIAFDFIFFSNIVPLLSVFFRHLVFKFRKEKIYKLFTFFEKWKVYNKYF